MTIAEQIGLLKTDSTFQTEPIYDDSVIDLDNCIGETCIFVDIDGALTKLDIPKDCRFVRLVKVDGKWELWPEDRETLIRHFGQLNKKG